MLHKQAKQNLVNIQVNIQRCWLHDWSLIHMNNVKFNIRFIIHWKWKSCSIRSYYIPHNFMYIQTLEWSSAKRILLFLNHRTSCCVTRKAWRISRLSTLFLHGHFFSLAVVFTWATVCPRLLFSGHQQAKQKHPHNIDNKCYPEYRAPLFSFLKKRKSLIGCLCIE